MNNSVVFVTGSLKRGGAERVISILTNELVERGWSVHIITLLSNEIGYELNNKIDIIDLSYKNHNKIFDVLRLITGLRTTLKSLKPVNVVSFMVAINILTWISTRGLSVRFIPSERNDPSIGRNRIIRFLSCRAYSASYKTVFQTERARSYFSKKIQNNGVIIHNPIIVNIKKDLEPHKKIVSVGRLEPQKNRILLINSFYDVHNKYPEYSLHIYGEGSQENDLRTLIKDLHLEASVFLHGNVQDVHKQIADAQIFILSSDFEGLSNALLEAMMMGLPCISTDCAGSSEVIVDGFNGFIIPIRDREAMVDSILKLITNSDLRESFSKNSIEYSSKFSVHSVVDKWELLLK